MMMLPKHCHYKFVFVLLLIVSRAFSQQAPELINSGELLEKGQQLHDDRKYKDAILLYKKIPRSDTNYYRALHELSLSNYYDSNFDASKQYAALGMQLFPEKFNEFYNLLANALDELKQTDSALYYYDKAIKGNANNYLAFFNKGVTLYNQKKYAEAKSCLQRALLINPYYASAHYFLAVINVEEGKPVPAMLGFVTYLVINPDNTYTYKAVGYLTKIASVSDEVLEKVNAANTKTNGDDFEMQQEILLSKIALDKKYKLQSDVEDPITRQLQVVLEKLEYNAGDKGFTMQYYVPFLQRVFAAKEFNAFTNYIFSGLQIKSVDQYNKKNKKEIQKFTDDAVEYFNEIRRTQTLGAAARKTTSVNYYFANNAVSGKGTLKPDGKDVKLVGPWEFYYSNGNLKSRGVLNDMQNKDGEWNFYNENGEQSEKSIYSNGKANGKSTSWFDNGLVYLETAYKDDVPDGERKQYYYNGFLRSVENYANGKKNGKATGYSITGNLSYKATYKDDKLVGDLVYYHPNGKVLSQVNYENGEANGRFKKFDEDGVLILEGDYVKDKFSGDWKEYYATSKIKKEYSYDNGDLNGLYKEYYENGNVSTKLEYLKGKLNNKEEDYDEDGKLFSEAVYEKGRLREVKFYDKTGKTISSATTRNGAGNLTFYDAYGNKTSEGYFTKEGLRDGKTTYYYRNGAVRETAMFKEGELNGEMVVYYRDGKISEKETYKNDKEDGLYTQYYTNGKIKYQGWYVDGQKQGEHTAYDALGNVVTKRNYLNNDDHGYTEHYYPNGKIDYEQLFDYGWLKRITQFDSTGNVLNSAEIVKGAADFAFKHFNNKKYIASPYNHYAINGPADALFFDGSLSVKQFYKNGYLDSTYKNYYYGGQLRSEGVYQNGDKTGTWKYYYKNGKLNYTETYKNGEQTGKEVMYNEDGTLDKEWNYVDDKLEGPMKIYGDNNSLAVLLNYHNGDLISYTYEGKDGKLIEPIVLHNETGLVTAFYKNGNKSAEINFEDGFVNGIRKVYFTNGKTYFESTRVYSNEEGSKKVYFVNGQLAEDKFYVNDNLHGLTKSYYNNGKLKAEENWYYGDMNGECKYYDENGKLKQTMLYYYGVLQQVKNF